MLRVEGIHLRAGQFHVRDVHLHVRRGEYFVLMGATGSGKSLLLKSICGLIRPRGGRILLDGADVTGAEPRGRHIGYVPQDCGLFPHLTVAENITFTFWARGIWPVVVRWTLALLAAAWPLSYVSNWLRREQMRRWLARLAPLIDSLGIAYLLDRHPTALSGGERQKVAVARALAAEPGLLLLDEPVSSLDEPTRRETCRQLRQTQQALGIATLHVCHNLEEARSVSDRLGVMSAGRLIQTGPLEELIAHPADPAVARLMNVQWGPPDAAPPPAT